MKIKRSAAAGTLESSDVMIKIAPPDSRGLHIYIESIVIAQFGEAIERTVREVLNAFDVTDANVVVNDKGALDWVIRARMKAALCRAGEWKIDWEEEGK